MTVKINADAIRRGRTSKQIPALDMANYLNMDLNTYYQLEDGVYYIDKSVANSISLILDVPLNEIYIENYKATKILTMYNQKGGVGKTTVTISLSGALAEKGYKCLVIDLDPQVNLTNGFGSKIEEGNTIYDILMEVAMHPEEIDNLGKPLFENYINHTNVENIDIICGSHNISNVERLIFSINKREKIFKKLFAYTVQSGKYDFIIFDNPPTKDNALLVNTLYCSHYAIAPIDLSMKFSVDGLAGLFAKYKECKEDNDMLLGLRVLINNFDKRLSQSREYKELIQSSYKEILFETIIRTDSQIEAALAENIPINKYKCKTDRAASDFKHFAEEITNLQV